MYTLKFYTKIRADGLVVQNISMGNFLFGKNQLQLFDKVFNQKYIFSKVGNALIPRRFYGQKKFHYRIIFDDRFQSVTNSRVIDHDLKKFKSKFEVDTSKISNSPIDCSEYASRFVKVTINKQFIKIIFFDLVLLEGKIKKENNSYSFL